MSHLVTNDREHIGFDDGISQKKTCSVISVALLTIMIDSKLRFNKHYRQLVNKAQYRASLIFKTFLSKEPLLLFKAFTVYVRPIIEYCSSVWSPVYKSDIELIERVQRGFTKRLRGLKYLTYSERLSYLKAETLELRRLKTDLLLIYKIIHKLVALNFDDFFAFNNFTVTRGHDFKLVKPLCVNNARQFSFSCRLIDVWNSLPNSIVSAKCLLTFKNLLNKYNFNKFLLFA